MTVDETKMVLGIIKTAYSAFYKDLSLSDAKQLVDLWAMMFASDNVKVVTEAVKSLMCTLRYPPTIADVKEKIALLTQPQSMTEMEAWGFVLSAVKNANYEAENEFNGLPPLIQKIVGSPNQLREWAMMDAEVVNSVVQSNFMRSYKVKVSQEKEYNMLPESAKETMRQIGGKVGVLELKK